jgi:hypothetical protein
MKWLSFILFVASSSAADWYISTSGSSLNSGTLGSPWSLRFALTNVSSVLPGDTLWLRGGTYPTYTSTNYPYVMSYSLVGTSNNPIVIRPYNGERAVIEGGLAPTSLANGIWFWGLEFTCSNARTNIYPNRPGGLNISGFSKAINLVFHDTGHSAIGGTASEIHGCIISGTGIYEYDNVTHFQTNTWTRGSGMYLQNYASNTFLVTDNISCRNFTSGMKAYAENGFADGFVFDGNIVFNNDGEGIENECLNHSITNSTVINNFIYHCLKSPFGYFGDDSMAQHYSLLFSNNYVLESPGGGVAALWLKRWKQPTVVNNTIVTVCRSNDWSAGSGLGTLGAGGKFIEIYPSTNTPLTMTINNNAYYGGVEQGGSWYDAGIFHNTYVPFYYVQGAPYDGTNGVLSFAYWQNSHGFDLNSSYTTNMPTANVVRLRPNKYEQGRANLVVINWESNNTATVNLSQAGLRDGHRFEVRDVQNYFGTAILTTNYSAASPSVVIPLTNTNVTPVSVEGDSQYVHTSQLFNVFIIQELPSGLISLGGAMSIGGGSLTIGP